MGGRDEDLLGARDPHVGQAVVAGPVVTTARLDERGDLLRGVPVEPGQHVPVVAQLAGDHVGECGPTLGALAAGERVAAHVRQHDHRELQALGLVHRHQLDRPGHGRKVHVLAGPQLLSGVEVGEEGSEPGAAVGVTEPLDQVQEARQADIADAVPAGREVRLDASTRDRHDSADEIGQRGADL